MRRPLGVALLVLGALGLPHFALAGTPTRELRRALLGAAAHGQGGAAALGLAASVASPFEVLALTVRDRDRGGYAEAREHLGLHEVAWRRHGLLPRRLEALVSGPTEGLAALVRDLGPDRVLDSRRVEELVVRVGYSYGAAPSDHDLEHDGWFPPFGMQRYSIERTMQIPAAEAVGLWSALGADAAGLVGERIRRGEWSGHFGGYLEDLAWTLGLPGGRDPVGRGALEGAHRY